MLTKIVDGTRSLGEKLEGNVRMRHIFFLIAAFTVMLLYGYYFGTFDQVIHIPFLKKSADPTLYPNDIFFDLRYVHYSFFWYFFVPFYKVGLLEIVLFLTHFLTIYLTIWATWKISYTLFHSGFTSLLAVIAMMFPHFGFSAFPFFEFSILNRTFALPIELFALCWYLEKKTLRAILLLGIVFNIHAISVGFLLAMILLDMLMRFRSLGLRAIVKHMVVFLLGASPVLVWRLNQSSAGLQANREWFDILDRGIFSHLFHFFSLQNPYINLLTLGGISALVLFFVLISHKKNRRTHMDVSMTHFMYASVGILLVQVVASLFAPSAFIIAAQITRVGVFINLFCYLYAADFIKQSCKDKSCGGCIAWIAGLITSLSPFILFVLYMLRNSLHKANTLRWVGMFMGSFFVITLTVSTSLGFWKPGIYIFPPRNAFNDVQKWAHDNTPKEAVFITPPEHFWLYETEWRVLSERSTVSTVSELLEAAFDPGYIVYWKPRFEDVAPGALAQFRGNFLENKELTKKAFYSLTTEDIVAIAKKYGASYVVVEKPYEHRLNSVYENDRYRVYSVK